MTGAPPDLAITAWYANKHRLLERCHPDSLANLPTRLDLLTAQLGKIALQQIKTEGVRSLETFTLSRTLQQGLLFTLEARFNSKGLAGIAWDPSGTRHVNVTLTAPLRQFGDDRQLVVEFSSTSITTSTGFGRLGGRPSLFVYGYIRELTKTHVIASPFVIGDLVVAPENGFPIPWRDACRVDPGTLGLFAEVKFLRRVDKSSLEALKTVPERRFKELVPERLGLAEIPKDWGGENCDIFAPNVVCDGERRDSAWVLKGPAAFHALQMKDCGKNGDQIVRLFDNPASLFVLQHCRDVTPAVRKTMYAFAREPARIGSRVCIIDGYDTWRICKHFGVMR